MDSHDVLGRLAEYLERRPSVAETAFIAPSATLAGEPITRDPGGIFDPLVTNA